MVRSEALQSWLYICGRLTYLLPRARYAGGDLTIQDIERILHYMVIESILKEQFEVQQPYGTVIAYMQVRPRHFAAEKDCSCEQLTLLPRLHRSDRMPNESREAKRLSCRSSLARRCVLVCFWVSVCYDCSISWF